MNMFYTLYLISIHWTENQQVTYRNVLSILFSVVFCLFSDPLMKIALSEIPLITTWFVAQSKTVYRG